MSELEKVHVIIDNKKYKFVEDAGVADLSWENLKGLLRVLAAITAGLAVLYGVMCLITGNGNAPATAKHTRVECTESEVCRAEMAKLGLDPRRYTISKP